MATYGYIHLLQALRYTGKLGTMASEEEDMPVNAALSLEDRDGGTCTSWALRRFLFKLLLTTCGSESTRLIWNCMCEVFVLFSSILSKHCPICRARLQHLAQFCLTLENMFLGLQAKRSCFSGRCKNRNNTSRTKSSRHGSDPAYHPRSVCGTLSRV